MVVANFMVLDLKGIPVVLLWNWRSILRVRSCAHHHVSYPIVGEFSMFSAGSLNRKKRKKREKKMTRSVKEATNNNTDTRYTLSYTHNIYNS
jgi:hypothetical protein